VFLSILLKIFNSKEIPETTPAGIEYILTNKGLDLVPILENLCNWEKTYANGKEIDICVIS